MGCLVARLALKSICPTPPSRHQVDRLARLAAEAETAAAAAKAAHDKAAAELHAQVTEPSSSHCPTPLSPVANALWKRVPEPSPHLFPSLLLRL